MQEDRSGRSRTESIGAASMNNIIYIVGLVVVVIAVLSFLGLR
jgi:small-conductance mechanosensitive channel